jgi:enoyl-CoA hydratase/carnithine racemase
LSAHDGPLLVDIADGVATVTIDHPPTNLVDGELIVGLSQLADSLDADPEVRAAVFVSADADFWLMHGDVRLILSSDHSGEPAIPNFAAQLFERIHSGRIFTLAAIDGAARGGGAEFAAALDMRLGTARTVIGQPEAAMGILPGATGSARLPRLIGRSHALELILTSRDLDANEALEIGWLDRLVDASALVEVAQSLARRVASLSATQIAAVKRVVDTSLGTMVAALETESIELARLLQSGAHRQPMQAFLDAGGQTREGEASGFDTLVDGMLAVSAMPGEPDIGGGS